MEEADIAPLLEAATAAYDRGAYEVALEILRPLAERGNARAQGILGIMYGLGLGVATDYGLAWHWLTQGGDQHDPNAEYNLGALYDKGLGVRQDFRTAASWFRRAANQNAAVAQYSLGVYYDEGLGVPQDFVLAYMWHHIAATAALEDDVRAMAVRERRLVAGKLTRAEIARARRLARKTASGFPSAIKAV